MVLLVGLGDSRLLVRYCRKLERARRWSHAPKDLFPRAPGIWQSPQCLPARGIQENWIHWETNLRFFVRPCIWQLLVRCLSRLNGTGMRIFWEIMSVYGALGKDSHVFYVKVDLGSPFAAFFALRPAGRECPLFSNSCRLSRTQGGGDAGSLTPMCSASAIRCNSACATTESRMLMSRPNHNHHNQAFDSSVPIFCATFCGRLVLGQGPQRSCTGDLSTTSWKMKLTGGRKNTLIGEKEMRKKK